MLEVIRTYNLRHGLPPVVTQEIVFVLDCKGVAAAEVARQTSHKLRTRVVVHQTYQHHSHGQMSVVREALVVVTMGLLLAMVVHHTSSDLATIGDRSAVMIHESVCMNTDFTA